MDMLAICFRGRAPLRGCDQITLTRDEARYIPPGDYLRTAKAMTAYELFSGTEAAEAALTSLLNARTVNHLRAFTSQYGPLDHVHHHDGGLCVSVTELRDLAAWLRRLNELLLDGKYIDANPVFTGPVQHPFAVALDLSLGYAETVRGFSSVLVTKSLYRFLVHEVVVRALAHRSPVACSGCGEVMLSARPDRKFCTAACKQKNHRLVVRSRGTAAEGPPSAKVPARGPRGKWPQPTSLSWYCDFRATGMPSGATARCAF